MFPQRKIISNLNLQYDNMKQELWKFILRRNFYMQKSICFNLFFCINLGARNETNNYFFYADCCRTFCR